MYLIDRDFPLKPGPKSLKITNIRGLVAGRQPAETDISHINKPTSAIFVVQEGIVGLVSTIKDANHRLLAPDHLRILVAGREEIKKHIKPPIFWVEKGGKLDGFISLLPINNIATWTLLGRIKLAQRAHYDPQNGELTALFGPTGGTSIGPVLNLKAEFFRSRVFDGLSKPDQKVVGGCIQLLEGLDYGEKDTRHEELVAPAVWRIIHTVFLSRK